MLPIQIETLPNNETSFQVWKLVEKRLTAIADKEKRCEDLDARDRIANNAIAYACYHASKKQWSDLWQYLLDRQIISLGDVVKPKRIRLPKLCKPQSERRSSPKVNKQSTRKVHKPTTFMRLKPNLIRLESFTLICNWIAYIAPLCPRSKRGFHLRDRPLGDRAKSLLTRKSKHGNTEYSSLKVRLRSSGEYYRMNDDVKALLIGWSGTPLRFSLARLISTQKNNLGRRQASTEELNQALNDKWQDSGAIAIRLNKILGHDLSFRQVRRLLDYRNKIGEIYQLNNSRHEISYYSKVQATEFEGSWLTLDMAYRLARSRGCAAAKNTFRKNHYFNYAEFGLEFRKDVPETDNVLLRWRDVLGDRSSP